MALDKARAAYNGDMGDDPNFQASPEELEYLDMLKRKLAQPQAPRYTPEQIAERKRANDRDYALGMMGMVSQNEDLQKVGQQMYSEALKARQPHITEHGSYDDLSGEFTYDPDYVQQRTEDQYGQSLNRIGTQRAQAALAKQAAADRRALAEQNAQYRREIADMNRRDRPEKLIWGVDPDTGEVVRMPDAPNVQRPAVGGGQPTEGERKAATLLARLRGSQQQLQAAIADEAKAAKPTVTNRLIGSIPFVGEPVANALRSDARQRVEDSQLDILDAALTLGTGASYTREQLVGYARSYFPQPNDKQGTIRDKQRRLQSLINSAEIAAGRLNTEHTQGGTGKKGTNFPKARDAGINPDEELPP